MSNILGEENHHKIVAELEIKIEAATFAAKNNNQPLRDYCGKLGHQKVDYWSLHGKPIDGRQRGGRIGGRSRFCSGRQVMRNLATDVGHGDKVE